MDEREARRTEQEARRALRERPVRTAEDPIVRYLFAVAYAQGGAHRAAPQPEAAEAEEAQPVS